MEQTRYMQRESDWIRMSGEGLIAWLRRRPPLMPIIAFVYTLFGKGLIFSGRAGIFYALQRMVAEVAFAHGAGSKVARARRYFVVGPLAGSNRYTSSG
jgi:uncharacterized RDD family membrane protein YckC